MAYLLKKGYKIDKGIRIYDNEESLLPWCDFKNCNTLASHNADQYVELKCNKW